MKFISSIFKGIFIGIGAILPGISSGVFCVIFGIYDKLINSVLTIFKNFKKNFIFLLPIGIGGVIGFFLFGNILNSLFLSYESECKALFLGFIIGGLPSLFKTANSKGKFRPYYLIYTLLCFTLGIFLFLLEKNLSTSNIFTQNSFPLLFLSGLAMSAGIIIPGVSSTIILMCFGTYYTYLNAISTLNYEVLFPIGLGVIIGSILFLLIIRFLLNKFPLQTYYSIIGFVLGSTLVIVPNNFSLLTIVLFFLGLSITFGIDKKSSC